MLDDNRDNDMMRRQTLSLFLMMGLVWAYFSFVAPKPPVVEPQPVPESQALLSETGSGEIVRARVDADATGEATSTGDVDAQWPLLPPVPVQTDPAADEIRLRDDDLELVFTRIGGRLKRASVLIDEDRGGSLQLVPQSTEGIPDTEALYPLGLRFTDELLGDELDFRRFDAVLDGDGRGVTFVLDVPHSAVVRKHFRLSDERHVVDITIEYENREAKSRTLGIDVEPAYILNWGPSMVVANEGSYFTPEFVWHQDGLTETFKPKELPVGAAGPEDKRVPGIDWIGYKSTYFLAAFKPRGDDALTDGWVRGTEDRFRFGVYEPKFDLLPGEIDTGRFRLYLGPMQLESLEAAWPTLTDALRFFGPGGFFGDTVSDMMDWFAKLLLGNLTWWRGFVPSYGIAIILLTVLVRGLMFPLMLKQIRSMKRMQALQPEMAALKEEYKDDPQAYQKATMEFYRERKINPLAGCFPLFLQMPVFFALYRMLWKAFELRGADFLWIKDLSQPDSLFDMPFMAGVPYVGTVLSHFNLLPLLVGVTMLISFKIQPTTGPTQNPQQKMIMNFMPIMFAVISYRFAAGLNLYVFTSTLLGIVQNRVVRATDVGGPAPDKAETPVLDDPKKESKPAKKSKPKSKKAAPAPRRKKPQHFYDRAQQRKKEMSRSGKKRNKKK